MQNDSNTSAFLALRFQLRKVASAILKSEEETDDALQDLFLKTWKMSPGKPEKHRAYLFSALKNICIDIVRKKKMSVSQDEMTSTKYIHNNYENTDSIEYVRNAMNKKLSGLPRQVFEQYVFNGLDYDEIAMKLGISVEAVRTNMSRARKVIREYCKEISGYER